MNLVKAAMMFYKLIAWKRFKDVILHCSKSGVVEVPGGYAEPSTDSGYFP